MSKVRQKRRTLNQSDKEEIGLCCCNCGSTEDLQYHHIVPVASGGRDINSNMCCLCYKCHFKIHHLRDPKVNNFGEMIKKGQAKAKAEGRFTGQQANIITIVKKDASKYVGTVSELSKIFKRCERTIEIWCKNGIPESVKRKLGLDKAYYSEIKHPLTKNIDNLVENSSKIVKEVV